MRFGAWSSFAGLAIPLVLGGCNLFNPGGGSQALNCASNDADCLLLSGENYYRNQQFRRSMQAYEQAVDLDSTRSLGYYGYAKAAVRRFDLDNLAVLNDLDSTQSGAEFAFLQHDESVLTLRLQAASAVNRALDILTDRDSLTRFYAYIDDTTGEAATDTIVQRRQFMIDYLTNAALYPDSAWRPESEFPLTDFEMPASAVTIDLMAYKMLYKVTQFRDLDRNDTVDARDSLLQKLLLQKDGTISGLSEIADQLENDSGAAENLNNMILDLQNGFGDLGDLASLLPVPVPSDDDTTDDASEQAQGNIDSIVRGMGGSLVFYQFGDGLDNDADGCIDEEILDELDNDLDGFIDEDARVTLVDGVNNDRDGGTDDAFENLAGDLPSPYEPDVLTYVGNFIVSSNQHPDSAWVKIKKGDSDMDIRIRIQQDSLAVNLTPGEPVPVSLQDALDSAKTFIGGCWRHY